MKKKTDIARLIELVTRADEPTKAALREIVLSLTTPAPVVRPVTARKVRAAKKATETTEAV